MNVLELYIVDDTIALGQVPKIQLISVRKRDGTGSKLEFFVHHIDERNDDVLDEISIVVFLYKCEIE